MPCYPAHSTHIYQGLDVTVFGPQGYWSQVLDRFYHKTTQHINKTKFISVYLEVHQQALTSQTIYTAFKITGVWPFNPDIISPNKMAPSLETLMTGYLPISQSSSIQALVSVICRSTL